MSGFWKILGEKEHKPNPRRKKKRVSKPIPAYHTLSISISISLFLSWIQQKINLERKKLWEIFPYRQRKKRTFKLYIILYIWKKMKINVDIRSDKQTPIPDLHQTALNFSTKKSGK